jgi:type VI secretion system protein ImpM
MSQVPVELSVFGKVPSRGDFVRSAHRADLTQMLDNWATQAVELMSHDARWKITYDQALPLHFAFLGMSQHAVLAGHLLPSADSAGRRFPLIAAGTFEVDAPPEFIARSPLVLARLWSRFEKVAQRLHSAQDASPVLTELHQLRANVDTAPGAYEASYVDFLEMHTVGTLQALLGGREASVDLRRAVLALGLLLQPVPASGSSLLEKGVRLPLPADEQYRPYVATLWVDLVRRFLSRGNFEVLLLVPRPAAGHRASLAIGFAGGDPGTLQAALDPQVGAQRFVDLSAPAWVDAQVQADYAIKKLSSYLEQPQLSLRQMLLTFGEAFLGE